MHSAIAIAVTLFTALVLTFLPMPDWTVWFRPAWVLLVMIYWAMATPYRVGVGVAWLVGMILDLLNGSMLGEHAFAMTVVIYFVSGMHIRMRMAPMLQQGFSVMLFILMYLFILFCIQGFIGELPSSQLYWLPAITSVILWPWLYLLLKDYRRRFKIA